MKKTEKTTVDTPVRLAINGCCGRMGALICEGALKDPAHFPWVGGTETPDHPQVGQKLPGTDNSIVSGSLDGLVGEVNLIVEFTSPKATLCHAEIAVAAKIPMVIGTTGFTADQLKTLQHHARRIPIFWSPNMSIGIVIIRRTITAVSELLFRFGLGEATHVSLSETHHTRKKDKPSGTAKALAHELLKATGWLIHEEEIEAKREGDVIGIHSLTFNCPSEKITLTHEATDRRVFADGALLVARNFHRLWQRPGWYGMDDFIQAIQESART